MKKILALMLALVMVLLCACGEESKPKKKKKKKIVYIQEVVESDTSSESSDVSSDTSSEIYIDDTNENSSVTSNSSDVSSDNSSGIYNEDIDTDSSETTDVSEPSENESQENNSSEIISSEVESENTDTEENTSQDNSVSEDINSESSVIYVKKETASDIGKNYYIFEPEVEHPGVAQMDAHYVMTARDKRNRDMNAENMIIKCDNSKVKINGNIVTIPYSVRSSGEKVKLSMYDKENPNRTGKFTFNFAVQFTEKPTFDENFDTLDPNIWKDDFYPDRMPISDLHCENGELVMYADTDTKEIELSTTGTFNQSYGSFSARIKMPKSGLSNVAFWLCTEAGVMYLKNIQRPSESGGEIDVVEYFPTWGPHKTSCSMHWNGWSTYHNQVTEEPEVEQTLSGEWHIYSCVWTSTAVYFYLDDQHISTYTGDGVGPNAGPMQILIQHSNPKKDDEWGGKYNPEELPNESRWDYVKVYGLVSE